MDRRFAVWILVGRPVAQVFEAVADPAQLSRYFTTGGASGRPQPGATLTWDFADFPGAFPVEVEAVEPNALIRFRWPASAEAAADSGHTGVEFRFLPTADGRTKVEVEESGWSDTPAGLAASYANCMGWAQMLAALKAWVEHGINLRHGAYK